VGEREEAGTQECESAREGPERGHACALSPAPGSEIPDRLGLLANSVTTYDGRDPTRARGVLVKTEVEASAR